MPEHSVPTREDFIHAYKTQGIQSDLSEDQIGEIYDILVNPARTQEFIDGLKTLCLHVGDHKHDEADDEPG